MLLAVPKKHMTQGELWSKEEMGKVAEIAARIGKEQCPNGFRLLSNFGQDGMQSQPHGHIHIIGGIHLGPLRLSEPGHLIAQTVEQYGNVAVIVPNVAPVRSAVGL